MAADRFDDDQTRSFTQLAAGTHVSHYRIIEKIGAGGMGEVYLALDTKLNRKVALKFLPSHLCQDEECRERFKREAQAVAKLSHPNVVTIYEVSEHQGRPFFAMELVEGQSLRDLAKGTELGTDRIIELAIQVCDGLSVAHDKKVVHRDIKPSNIVIDAYGRPKILDFGLAAIQGSEHLTKTGSTLGTVQYMSPEQVLSKDIDHRSDLFSLGVVLYELITKQNPFKRESDAATLKAVSDAIPHPVARFRADVPDGLQSIIDKALEKDVKTRYQHADGMLSDLMRIKRSLDSGHSTVSVTSQPSHSSRTWWFAAAIIVAVAAIAVIVTKPWLSDTASDKPDKIMLAVLPFENLGDPEDEYFADGITEEILTNLARLSGLGVISRTSAMQYKHTDKGLREIGEELGVDYVLEGTIRWDKTGEVSRVRIHPQLIEVANDIHLWADRYDAVIDDIFAVQSSIAERVAAALDVTLLASEREALASQPTENTEAYDYYLRGMQYVMSYETEKDLSNAEAMFLKAIELEPDFGLAYVWLSIIHTHTYWDYYDRTEQRLMAAKEAIDRAIEVSPKLHGIHIALGWYYYHGSLDYESALKEFAIAREKQPNNSRVYYGAACILRRQGKWDEAMENFRKAVELDPRFHFLLSDLGYALVSTRRYAEAETVLDRLIDLKPDFRRAYGSKSWLYVLWKGDTNAARRALQEALHKIDRWPGMTYTEITLDIIDGDYDHASELLTEPGQVTGLSTVDSADYFCLKGDVYRYLGKVDLMEGCYDSARVLLERMTQSTPDEPWHHAHLGWAYAGLGRKESAISEAMLAVELLPVSKDAVTGADLIKVLADVFAIVGEYDLAIDQLEYLLSIPSDYSAHYVRVWPDYTPFRDHPRFQALLEKYGDNHPGT